MTLGVNDYPWACCGCTSASDTWGYTIRQCTSFCAFRISQTGRPVPRWDNASTWDSGARASGYLVNGSPDGGGLVLAQWSPSHHPAGYEVGSAGHIMTVLRNNGNGTVLVEDYNWNYCCCYRQHSIPIAGTNFIHIGGSPAPPPPPPTPAPPPAPAPTLTSDTTLAGLAILAAAGAAGWYWSKRSGLRPVVRDRQGRHAFGAAELGLRKEARTGKPGPLVPRPGSRAFE